MSDNKMGRREFLLNSSILGAGALVGLTACSGGKDRLVPFRQSGEYYVPELPDKAIDGAELKVGMVGCGGRGTGALGNLLDAADNIKVVALGDVFPDQIERVRKRLREDRGIEVPDEMCFTGFDAYKKVCDAGIDMVISPLLPSSAPSISHMPPPRVSTPSSRSPSQWTPRATVSQWPPQSRPNPRAFA